MKRFPIAVAVAAFALMSATSAFADPQVNGVALNTTVATANANVSAGIDTTARQAIGVINGDTQVNGVLANTTVATANANVAAGAFSEACQAIGVVGSVGEACDD